MHQVVVPPTWLVPVLYARIVNNGSDRRGDGLRTVGQRSMGEEGRRWGGMEIKIIGCDAPRMLPSRCPASVTMLSSIRWIPFAPYCYPSSNLTRTFWSPSSSRRSAIRHATIRSPPQHYPRLLPLFYQGDPPRYPTSCPFSNKGSRLKWVCGIQTVLPARLER